MQLAAAGDFTISLAGSAGIPNVAERALKSLHALLGTQGRSPVVRSFGSGVGVSQS